MKQRTSLLSPAITALLLCGAFATPLAFAQTSHKHKKTTTTESSQTTSNDAGTTTTTSADASTTMGAQSTSTYGATNAATPATPATPYPGTGTPATPATPADAAAAASMGASPKTMSWSDLDTDHNGNLSKSEASSLNSLSQVFDAADANHDGSLSADEYRAYLKAQGK